MNRGKLLTSRTFALNPRFNYIPSSDRHFLATERSSYRFNVIGTGTMGQEHIRVTMLEGRATIKGVYDPNPGSVRGAQEAYREFAPDGELVVFDSAESAYLDPDVDGLIIATPNFTHIDLVEQAIKSGKHILIEKPVATTIRDAYAMYEISQEYPAVFQVGLQYRYKPTYREAIEMVKGQRNAVGNVKTISLLEHRIPFLDKVGQWNKFAQFSGDTLVEKCCHYFDLMNLFADTRPVSVYASGNQAVNFADYDYEGERSDILDNAMVVVNYANGIRGNFNLCMFAPFFYEELVLCGDEGHLKTWEKEDFLPQSSSQTGLDLMYGDERPSLRITPNYPAIVQNSGHHGATFIEHIRFIDNIEGKQTKTATALEGLWSIIVASAAQESIKTGQLVLVDDVLAANGITL